MSKQWPIAGVLLLLLLCLPLAAQIGNGTVSGLPSAGSYTNKVTVVVDGATLTDCTAGGGSYWVSCRSTGTVWTPAFVLPNAPVSFGSDPADTGNVRSSNNEQLCWEATPAGTDVCFKVNASNEFEFSAPINVVGSGGPIALTEASVTANGTAGKVNLGVNTSHMLQWYANGDALKTAALGSSSGVATSATVLATTRAIYGNNFDGSAALTQVIASTYGGTGNGFAKFSGPTTSEKTFTLPDANATITYTVGSGTASLGTSAISSGACATAVTVSATGVATTDTITFTPNADITAVTGYAPVTTGGLAIYPYPTSGNVNFKVCNPTSSSITPGAVTLNWRVGR